MRFELSSKPLPKLGDKKCKKRFAFFPVEINDNKKVWLESYYQHYIYANVMNYGSLDYGYHGEWTEDYRETNDFLFSSKTESIIDFSDIDNSDIEKRNKKLDDILSRI